MLTKTEKNTLSKIIMDEESGAYLTRSRSRKYFELRKELNQALETDNPNERQKMLIEFSKQCRDFEYYNSLPDEKKLLLI
jgi:hypothetical protein